MNLSKIVEQAYLTTIQELIMKTMVIAKIYLGDIEDFHVTDPKSDCLWYLI